MIKYDKRKFDAYQIPGVDEANFANNENVKVKKSSWIKKLLSKLKGGK